jgi:hypothetical protein
MNANSISVHNLRKRFPGFLLDIFPFRSLAAGSSALLGKTEPEKVQRSGSFWISCGVTEAALKYLGKTIPNTFNMEASALYLMNVNFMTY